MARLFLFTILAVLSSHRNNITQYVAAEVVEYSIDSWVAAQEETPSDDGNQQQQFQPVINEDRLNETSSGNKNRFNTVDNAIVDFSNADQTGNQNTNKNKNQFNEDTANNTRSGNRNKKAVNNKNRDSDAKQQTNSDLTSSQSLKSNESEARNSDSHKKLNLNGDQSSGNNNNKNTRNRNGNKQNGSTNYFSTTTQDDDSTNGLQSNAGEPCVVDDSMRAVQIKSVLMQVSDRFDLNDPNSPQYQAAAWIIYGDPMRLSPNDPALFQRYSAVVLYLATQGDKWYVCSANTTSPCGPSTKVGKNHTDLSYSYNGCNNNTDDAPSQKRKLNKKKVPARWLSGVSECKWYGIQCDSEAFIESIDLTKNNLCGELPPEIKTFCKATDMTMTGNKITGRLPTELGELDLLKNLRLGKNMITGEIPSTLFQLTTLERLDVHSNKLSGCLSTEIGNLKKLRRLQLSQNLFIGTIPRQIGNLGKLKTLQLQYNQFTGKVPDRICVLRYQYLNQLEADCASPPDPPLVNCRKTCCTACYSENERPKPTSSPTSSKGAPPIPSPARDDDFTRPPPTQKKTYKPTASSSMELKTFAPTLPPVVETGAPTVKPTAFGTSLCFTTPTERAKEILATLLNVTDLTTFQDTQAPQRKALDFIINTDDFIACPDSPNLVQRYVLSAFYYATNGETWNECSNDIKSSCSGVRWLSKDNECSWFGNGCTGGSEGNINSMNLEKNGLSGSLISEIGSLQNLQNIIFSNNKLTGTIPNDFGSLSKLKTLELQENNLVGSVPESLCALGNSQVISVDCQEVTCQEGCCTCYPLASKIANEDNAQQLTSGFVPLTNSTSAEVGDSTNNNENNDISQFTVDDIIGGLNSGNETGIQTSGGDKKPLLTNETYGTNETNGTNESVNSTVSSDPQYYYYYADGAANESDTTNSQVSPVESAASETTGVTSVIDVATSQKLPANASSTSTDDKVIPSLKNESTVTLGPSTAPLSDYFNGSTSDNNISFADNVIVKSNRDSAVLENEFSQKTENASVAEASSSGRTTLSPTFVSISVVLCILAGVTMLVLSRRRIHARKSNSLIAPPNDAFNLDARTPVPSKDEFNDLESISDSSQGCKDTSISSSNPSSKVKDKDVVKWWHKTWKG